MQSAFVGRSAQLRSLDERLERARSGRPVGLVVTGPAGIGKTALLRRWSAGAADARVVVVSGDEGETRLELGVVRRLATVMGADASLIAAPGDDPLVVGSRLVELFALGCRVGRVLVVLVDDAHWADQPSLRALTFAFRRLVAESVMTVLVTRDGDFFPETLRRLVDTGRAGRLAVPGLSAPELSSLAAALVGEATRGHGGRVVGKRLWEHTGGNPLHARALLSEVGVEVLQRATGPLPAPRSFSTLVLDRLRACSEGTERLVAAAAVLGARCSLGTAARVAGLAQPLEALQEAVDAGLLEEFGVAGEVRFPHALVRAAVYHGLGPARRSFLHQEAAGALPADVALDHRIAASLVPDGRLAAEVITHARAEATAGSVTAAAGHLAAAARLAPRPADGQRLLSEAALCLLGAGQVSEASALEPDLVAASPSAGRNLALGLLAFFGGRQAEAERLLAEAWDRSVLPDDASPAAQAAGFLAQLCSIQARLEDTLLWARRAMDVTGDPYLAPARSVSVCQLWFAGRWDEAGELIATGSAELATLGPQAAAETLLVRGLTKQWTDDPVGAREDLGASVRRCQPLLSSRAGLIALGHLAEAHFRAGEWDAATARSSQAVSLGGDTEQPWTSGFLHGMAVLPLAGRGQWDQAEAHARAALDAAAALGDVASLGYAASATMFLAACRRQPGRVLAAAEPLLRAERRLSLDYPGCHYRWQMLRAEALLDLGRLPQAEQDIASYAELTASMGLRIQQADAARLQGRLHAGRQEGEPAIRSFEQGEALLTGLAAPFERGLLGLAHGSFLRRTGQRRKAAKLLSEAAEIFAGLGARPALRRCEQELAGCGLTPAKRSTDHPRSPLTPQELAVAHLVARGATNRAVAADLVVSTKTVEYHLANIFRKLGVTSRGELTARLSDQAG